MSAPVQAVVFDMDGVIVETEAVWDGVRRELAAEHGRPWPPGTQRRMMGMSSGEWTALMHDELGIPLPPPDIARQVVGRLGDRYRLSLPLIPGAAAAVRGLARRWPMAVAASSNRELIELVLELAGIAGAFRAVVASEEVGRGKPAPDVYLEACRRLGADPARSAAVEDSTNGLLAARAAGMRVIAVPNREYPPRPEALGAADRTLPSIAWLWPAVVDPAAHPAAGGASAPG